MKPEYADEVVELMERYGSSANKLKPWKKFIVDVFEKEGRRATAKELLDFAKSYLQIPDWRPEEHIHFIRYEYVKQLVETGEYVPPAPSYGDKFDELKSKLRDASKTNKKAGKDTSKETAK